MTLKIRLELRRKKRLSLDKETSLPPESAEIVNEPERLDVGMTAETLEELRKKLEKFEKSERFIRPDVSLPYLISKLGTNSKYLHHVLKEEKGKSFNQYINDLRIDYIITKLYNDPKFRKYKVAYLAEASGFQSRSTFIKAFKSTTGLTPSYFIKRLKEDKIEV